MSKKDYTKIADIFKNNRFNSRKFKEYIEQ